MRAFRLILALALAFALAPTSDAGWPNSGRVYGGGASVIAVSINFPSGTVGGVGCASLSSCVADTRSTTATYVNASKGLSTAAVNTPRIDCTNATCGLLNEGASTNYAPYSVASSSNWGNYTNSGYPITFTSSAGTAPDGTNSLTKITMGATSSTQNATVDVAISGLSSGTYTHSVWVQANGAGNVGLPIALCVYASSCTSVSVTLASGIARVKQTVTVGSGPIQDVLGYPGGFSLSSYSTTMAFNVWGDQLELLAFPTSYIPTSGAAASRAADSLSATGALESAMSAGQSYVDMIDEATGATSRTLYAAGTFNWPPYKWITQICAYTPSVASAYLTAHSTYGTSC